MLPGDVVEPIDDYIAALRRLAPDQVAAVYAVGSLALADFSSRYSNVDLVVVGDPALTASQVGGLRRAEKGLARAGRAAEVWYTSWAEVAGDAGIGAEAPVAEPSTIATPMTRAMLRQDALALLGPDWPVVGFDDAVFRAWCSAQLAALTTSAKGLLVMRRAVTALVLEASRLAQGAITGKVFSKSGAGETVGGMVSTRYRRILTDAVGYRRGARTSMYWGPFERKYDALILLGDLMEAAVGARPNQPDA
jgi:hypothetical protein